MTHTTTWPKKGFIQNLIKGDAMIENWYNLYKIACSDRLIKESWSKLKPKEYGRRLEEIGWELFRNNEGHIEAYAPNGINSVTYADHKSNWERHMNYGRIRNQLLKESPDLEFVWESPFEIPNNYNYMTLRIEGDKTSEPQVETRYFDDMHDVDTDMILIQDGNAWKSVALIVPETREIMFADEKVKKYKPQSKITFRYI
jgi:hypothetical protein